MSGWQQATPGRRFEYRVRREFVTRGWYVTSPQPRSEGPADLIALRANNAPLLIQCKAGALALTANERAALLEMAHETGGVPIVVCKKTRKGQHGLRVAMPYRSGGYEERSLDEFGAVSRRCDYYIFNVAETARRRRRRLAEAEREPTP